MENDSALSTGGKDMLDLPESCNEFNTFVIPSKEVADFYGVIFNSSEEFMVAFIIPIVAIFGILCNLAFIFVLIRVQNMRTFVNFYLGNLAITDICALANTLGHGIWNAYVVPVNHAMPFPNALGCQMFYWEGYLFLFGSMIFVTLMTVERYLAICHPMYHRVINSKHRCVKLVVGCWVSAALLATLVIPSVSNVITVCHLWPSDEFFNNFPIVATFCIPADPALYYSITIFYFIQPIPFYVAMISSIYCYTRIIMQLSRRTVSMPSSVEQPGAASHVIKTRNDIAKMLVVNGIVFFLLSFPAQLPGMFIAVTKLTGNTWISERTIKQISWIGRCLLYMNSGINPIIFNIMSPRYRDAFRQAFGCSKMCKNRNPQQGLESSTTSVALH